MVSCPIPPAIRFGKSHCDVVRVPFGKSAKFWKSWLKKRNVYRASRKQMLSDFFEGVECVPQMVVFDVVPRDFKVVKQSAADGRQLRASNEAFPVGL